MVFEGLLEFIDACGAGKCDRLSREGTFQLDILSEEGRMGNNLGAERAYALPPTCITGINRIRCLIIP